MRFNIIIVIVWIIIYYYIENMGIEGVPEKLYFRQWLYVAKMYAGYWCMTKHIKSLNWKDR